MSNSIRKQWHNSTYRGHLTPGFSRATDEAQRAEYPAEARFPDPGNYGVGGYYGNTYKQGEAHAIPSSRREMFLHHGDDYRRLGDRRYDSDPQQAWNSEHPRRTGYRSLEERMEIGDRGQHRGKGSRSYKRSDARILEDLNEILYDDPFVNASDVETAVQDGEVILSGTVEDRQAKRRVEDLAESVRGVKNVQNRLRILESTL